MNFKFSDRSLLLLTGAGELATGRGSAFVGPEHILLAALGDDRVASLLSRLDVQTLEVREVVEGAMRRHGAPSAKAPDGGSEEPVVRGKRGEGLRYSSLAKKVLECSVAEAQEAGERCIEPADLLLGLIREKRGLAAEVLEGFEVTLERLRAARAGVKVEPRNRLRVVIDDASDSSIYEQIVAQVTEAVATATLQPGERLPSVRQLADRLDIAPGTVARAYSELERQKLVVTEGARGTRVAERHPASPAAEARPETLAGLLRPVVVAAFHLGGTAAELRSALEEAMRGIFDRGDRAA